VQVKIAASAAFLVLALAGVSRAESTTGSCSCSVAAADHAVKELGRHQSAFAGTVTEVEGERVTFDVARVWKGPRQKALTLTSTSKPGCSFVFEVGKDYMVYANGTKEALSTDPCVPNRELADASRTVKQLDLHAGYAASPLKVPAR
jgi:hypothetical protein